MAINISPSMRSPFPERPPTSSHRSLKTVESTLSEVSVLTSQTGCNDIIESVRPAQVPFQSEMGTSSTIRVLCLDQQERC